MRWTSGSIRLGQVCRQGANVPANGLRIRILVMEYLQSVGLPAQAHCLQRRLRLSEVAGNFEALEAELLLRGAQPCHT